MIEKGKMNDKRSFMKKIVITGSSGYLGRSLLSKLDQTEWCSHFYGIDIEPPLSKYSKGEWHSFDINDTALSDWMPTIEPDILIHLAFVVNPMKDHRKQRMINIEGTKNILNAAQKAGVKQILVASSATAYGAWPDNPIPLKETDPIRGHHSFQYAQEKFEQEGICQAFIRNNPDTLLSIIRPCVVYGPGVNNYLSALLSMPVGLALWRHNPRVQFIHEEDVVRAILTILEKKGKGAYNLAPIDTMPIHDVLSLTQKPKLLLPDSLLSMVLSIYWSASFLPFYNIPPSFIDFIRYPWIVDSSRLQRELGFEFTYSSYETIMIMLKSKGII